MTFYPLSGADLSDYVAVDLVILEEIKVLSRPDDVEVNDLVATTEPDVRHFGDVIGGLSEEQVDHILLFLHGICDGIDDPEQREVALQFALRGFALAARTSAMVMDRQAFDKLKADFDARPEEGE